MLTKNTALSYLAGHESDEMLKWKTKMLTKMKWRLKSLFSEFKKTGVSSWDNFGESLLFTIRDSAQRNFVGTRSQRLLNEIDIQKYLKMAGLAKFRPIFPDQLSRDLIKV